MKKLVMVLSLILCLSFAPFLKGYKTSVKANPTTWTVNPGESIQEAINNASQGDIIRVHKGTYHENVVINKSISLIGEEKETTIIDGSKSGSVIFIERTDNVVVKGFTLTNSSLYSIYDSGIRIERSSGSVIIDNIIVNNYNGIFLFYSDNAVISGNSISKNSEGISLWGAFNNLIENNVVLNNTDDGIILFSSQNNVISANTILNNSCGVGFYSSNGNLLYLNNFVNNAVHVSSAESINFWNYTSFGNYWSVYRGQDLDGDGVSDSPYIIDESGQMDNHPLMGMFYEFDFTYNGKIYQIDIISNSTISDFHFQIGNETGNKILQFKVEGNVDMVGFCRIIIPTQFIKYPYIVLVGNKEINPIFLDVSNETHAQLYFTYSHENQTIRIISSELYSEYRELLDNYQRLQEYFYHLNMTYYNLTDAYADLQKNFSDLLSNYTWLQEAYQELNSSYNEHLRVYSESISDLLDNFSRLQNDYQKLNTSYNELLLKYSENVDKVQNLTYILAATTSILIIATAYLSKHAHAARH
ncbi:MAG: NosD domain-containing protein [Candidatus Bathyarchaeia archaeon]